MVDCCRWAEGLVKRKSIHGRWYAVSCLQFSSDEGLIVYGQATVLHAFVNL